MRFRRVELRAFGPFRGETLELPAHEADLWVIHGPNGAGKSSLLRALTDMLFGIPANTRDDFFTPKSELQIAAVIEHGAKELAFCRRKGNKHTLLDWNGTTKLDPEALSSYLSELDRTAFENRYGMSTELLREGAQAMLAADAGQILVQASGLPTARKLQAQLQDEMDAIFKPQAQKPRLNAALSSYQSELKKLRSIQIPPDRVRQLLDRLAAARQEKTEADQTAGRLRAHLSRLERIQANRPAIQNLDLAEAELARVASAPDLPGDASTQRVQAEKDAQYAEDAIRSLDTALTADWRALEALPRSSDFLNRASEIEAAHGGIEQYRKEERDLETRREELLHARARAQSLWEQFQPEESWEQVSRWNVRPARQDELQALAGEFTTLATRREAAQREVQQAREQCAALASAQPAGELPDASRLAALLAEVREAALDKLLAEQRVQLERAEAEAAARLRSLPHTPETIAALAALRAPLPETRQRLAGEWKDAEERTQAARGELEAARRQLQEAEQQSARLGPAEAPGAGTLANARAERDRLWQRIRRAWMGELDREEAQRGESAPLEESLDRALRHADSIADDRFAHAASLQQIESSQQAAEQARNRVQQQSLELERRQNAFARAQAAWREPWSDMPQPLPLPPEEMEAWLRQREEVMTAAGKAEEIRFQVASLTQRVAEEQLALSLRLTETGAAPAGAEESLAALARRAQAHLEDLRARAQARGEQAREAERLSAAVRTGESALDGLEKEQEQWRERWQAALAGLPLPPSWTPAQVLSGVANLVDCQHQIEQARDLEHRIAGMEKNRKAFAGAVATLTAILAPDLRDRSPDHAADQLQERLTRARQQASDRESLEKQIRKAEGERRAAVDKRQAAARRLEALCRQAGCADLKDLPAREEASRRKRDWSRAVGQQRQALESGNGKSLAAIRDEAASEPPEEVEARMAQLQAGLTECTRAAEEALRSATEAATELKRLERSEEAARAAQAAAGHLAVLASAAEQYARLYLARAIVDRGVEQFRKSHETPLLAHAGPVFAALSLGGFQRLDSGFDDRDRPVLRAVRADGRSTAPAGLSDGERDQLYLALRIAAARLSPPMPMILDDVLMTFDDPRTRAGLEQLRELSRHTQVLLLTHHQHVVEAAAGLRVPVLPLAAAAAPLAAPAAG